MYIYIDICICIFMYTHIYVYMYVYVYTYMYIHILTKYILTNVNLLNLNNNLLILFFCVIIKVTVLLSTIDQITGVTTSESFEVNFFPDLATKQFNTSNSNEIYEVNFFSDRI